MLHKNCIKYRYYCHYDNRSNKDVIISDAKGAAVANVDTTGKVEGEHNNNTICNDSISQNAVSAENIFQDDLIVSDFTSINIDCDFFDAIDAAVMPHNIDISHSESGLIANECIASDLPDNIQPIINVEATNLNKACELNNDDFLVD